MIPKHPSVVVFDIGGVLARIANTWQQAAAVAGVDVLLPEEPPVYLEDLPAFLDYQVGAIGEDEYLHRLAAQLGVTPDQALRAHNGILIEPFLGTETLVDDLERLGVVTGVLSNTNRPHWDVLDDPSRYPAIARICRKMPSHAVKMEKPDPRIFELFCTTFDFRPSDIVYFDDNARNIASALSLGWRATQIDPTAGPVAQMREVLSREGILEGQPGR